MRNWRVIAENLEIRVEACRRDIATNGDGPIGFSNKTLKSQVLADMEHALWVATMKLTEQTAGDGAD